MKLSLHCRLNMCPQNCSYVLTVLCYIPLGSLNVATLHSQKKSSLTYGWLVPHMLSGGICPFIFNILTLSQLQITEIIPYFS